MIANRAAQHGIARFQRIEYRSEGNLAVHFERHFVSTHLRERA